MAERQADANRAYQQVLVEGRKTTEEGNAARQREIDLNEQVGASAAKLGISEAQLADARGRAQKMIAEGQTTESEFVVTRRLLAESLAKEVRARGEQVSTMNTESGIRSKLNAQVEAGTISLERAQAVQQQQVQLADLRAKMANAEGSQLEALQQQEQALIASFKEEISVRAEQAALAMKQNQKDEIALIEAEAKALFKSATERAAVVAQLRAEQEARRQLIPETESDADWSRGPSGR